MSASIFAQLPPQLLVEVLSCLTYNSAQLAWFSSLCQPVCATLGQDTAWRHLCRRYWYATEDRIREWPSLSPQGLYRALEQWAPLEGYYVLTPAFPWGLLVLVRIADGRVLADVIRFLPRPDGTFTEVPVTLFRVTFKEERPGVVRSVLDAPWSGGEEGQLSGLDPAQLRAATVHAECFADRMIAQARLFTTRRALRITASKRGMAAGKEEPPAAVESAGDEEPAADAESDSDSEPPQFIVFQNDHKHWGTATLFTSPEQAKEGTEEMLEFLLGQRAVPCDLALIRSPVDYCPQDAGFPGIRPGLYVGDYGHEMYGQFRTEVLLLEYSTFEPENLAQEAGEALFARPQGHPPPSELALLAHVSSPVTFMRGVKQCGDVHVPMGATTFVAVCGPPEACEALAAGPEEPRVVLNRQSQQQEVVRRAWRGFGTLASEGFGFPDWADGWLVQLQDDASTGDHRFGFVWARRQDAVVLQWIAAQDTSPFLQRTWLPEDLQ